MRDRGSVPRVVLQEAAVPAPQAVRELVPRAAQLAVVGSAVPGSVPKAAQLAVVGSAVRPEFLERAAELGGLPRFVVREFEQFLKCGILAHGCLRLECRDCGHSLLVAFSCKRRGFCPSCVGRRMADLAVHLEQAVFPEVPVRHWICSFPWGLR